MIGRLIRDGMKEINHLHAIMHNEYARVPETLRAWESASHIDRAPQRRTKTTSETAAATNGNGAATAAAAAYPAAVRNLLYERGVRCFKIGNFAEPLRESVRENAEQLARAAGLEIEYLPQKKERKEDRIAAILAQRGDHPGLVHIFRPWRLAAALSLGGRKRADTPA